MHKHSKHTVARANWMHLSVSLSQWGLCETFHSIAVTVVYLCSCACACVRVCAHVPVRVWLTSVSVASASHALFAEDARLYARQESTVLGPHSDRSCTLLQILGNHRVFFHLLMFFFFLWQNGFWRCLLLDKDGLTDMLQGKKKMHKRDSFKPK